MCDQQPDSQNAKCGDAIQFFYTVCHEPSLQKQLKAPCPANREGFARVARARGYALTGDDLDTYVRFYGFYAEFQKALERHFEDSEALAGWLRKWEKHVAWFRDNPMSDRRDTIRRYFP